MPRLIQAVPKYQKHRASGQAVVTINGRDYYLGPHGTKASKLEYDRLITEWLSSGRSTSYGAPEHALTIVELLADYLKHAAGYYGKNMRGEYAQIVRASRPLKELYGRTAAVDFGVLQFKAVRQHVAAGDLSARMPRMRDRRPIRELAVAPVRNGVRAALQSKARVVIGSDPARAQPFDHVVRSRLGDWRFLRR